MLKRIFIPAYIFALMIIILASLPGDKLQRIQSYPENPIVRIILSDPFMHFLVFGPPDSPERTMARDGGQAG